MSAPMESLGKGPRGGDFCFYAILLLSGSSSCTASGSTHNIDFQLIGARIRWPYIKMIFLVPFSYYESHRDTLEAVFAAEG